MLEAALGVVPATALDADGVGDDPVADGEAVGAGADGGHLAGDVLAEDRGARGASGTSGRRSTA